MSIEVSRGRSRLFNGFSDPRDSQILSSCEADTTGHRSIPRSQKNRCHGLQAKATGATVGCARRLSCLSIHKVYLSAVRASGARHPRPARRPAILRSSHKNIRYHDQKDSDESHQSLQDAMESPLRS
jgi:hypothetical protein